MNVAIELLIFEVSSISDDETVHGYKLDCFDGQIDDDLCHDTYLCLYLYLYLAVCCLVVDRTVDSHLEFVEKDELLEKIHCQSVCQLVCYCLRFLDDFEEADAMEGWDLNRPYSLIALIDLNQSIGFVMD